MLEILLIVLSVVIVVAFVAVALYHICIVRPFLRGETYGALVAPAPAHPAAVGTSNVSG